MPPKNEKNNDNRMVDPNAQIVDDILNDISRKEEQNKEDLNNLIHAQNDKFTESILSELEEIEKNEKILEEKNKKVNENLNNAELNNGGAVHDDAIVDKVLGIINEIEANEKILEENQEEINKIDDNFNLIDENIVNEEPPKEEPPKEEPPKEEPPKEEPPKEEPPKEEPPKEEPPKEEAPKEEPPMEEPPKEEPPKEEVKNQEPPKKEEAKKIDNEVNGIMFMNKLNSFNSMFKTDISADKFIAGVAEAWELLNSQDKEKQAAGKKTLGNLFKDTLKQAFEAEKKLAYDEHRIPEFADIAISANELLRVSMFTFTDLYTNKKNEALFNPTAFGGLNEKDIAELTKGESLWSMDQKSDEAWEIQSADAKGLADKWLGEEKPYEKMIKEMNALADKRQNSIIKTDSKEIYTKLAAAEWMLLNNDKMMIEDPEDPLNKMPNWGNKYWKAIIQAREALGIPKHTSMRSLIQGDYEKASKAVNNPKYHERQIKDNALDPDAREMIDSLDAQKADFTIQREAIATSLPDKNNNVNNLDMGDKNRVPYPVPQLDERKNLLEAPKDNNFIIDKEPKLDMEKSLN